MVFWNKLHAAERLAAIGAIVILVSGILGLAGSFGFGVGWIPLLGAIAVLVIYYLKYSPTQTINWPAPTQTIVLAISAVVAILSILGLLPILSLLGAYGSAFGLYTISLIGTVVGSVIMAWGAWQDYQAMPKTTPPTTPPPTNPPV